MANKHIESIVVYVTAPQGEAGGLARALVENKLAACVNILPLVRSVYTWQGEICEEDEALLVIKTRASLLEALREKVIALHSYDVPEVIAMPITGGHPPYLSWIAENTRA